MIDTRQVQDQKQESMFIGVSEAAKILGVHPATIRRMIDSGEIQVADLNKSRYRINRAAFYAKCGI